MKVSQYWLAMIAGAVMLFLLAPIVTMMAFSFNISRYYAFPMRGLTLKWYEQLLSDTSIGQSLLSSLFIAMMAMAAAGTFGTLFAFFIVRARIVGKRALASLGFLPLVVPVLVLAAGLQSSFVALRLPLGYIAVMLGHTVYTTPFVTLMVTAQLIRYDTGLDAAARDLGATAAQSFRLVTLPILWPAMRAGALLAFLMSFNEWAIAFFNGRGFNTLPMLFYSLQRNGLPPTVLAYSTLSIVLVLVVAVLLTPMAIRLLKGDK
ncbi:ABC transporter permease [Martelella alba]|uniref:ABC transporter permease subunit n=1 Tax=Martelella alba TaxID=2590451 RepID=A0ABY2SJR4_9HYPH|nr:ABC transporter permease subunit [Martelella alba]TKI05284.1 ABC transporter permease subunit [Martelella alba]